MAASISDKITKTTNGSRPVATTVTATRAPGVTTLSGAAFTGWEDSTTAVHFQTYSLDASSNVVNSTVCDWKGIVSGTNITNLTLKAGTDNGNSIGDIIAPVITAAWGDEMAQGILAEHSTTGVHDATKVGMLAGTQTFTGAKTFSGNATFSSQLNVGSINVAGAWQSWTPTLSGRFTDGDWTKTGKYIQIGKTVIFRMHLVSTDGTPLGGGSGSSTFTLPVTAVSYAGLASSQIIGVASLIDAAAGQYPGSVIMSSTTTAYIVCSAANSIYTQNTDVLSSAPFAWGVGDEMHIWGSYEAA